VITSPLELQNITHNGNDSNAGLYTDYRILQEHEHERNKDMTTDGSATKYEESRSAPK
jgi:hypothetical protein